MAIFPETKPPESTQPTSVHLSADVLERVDAVAKRQGLSRSKTIQYMLLYALPVAEQTAKTGP